MTLHCWLWTECRERTAGASAARGARTSRQKTSGRMRTRDDAHPDLINPNAGPLGAVFHGLIDKGVGTIWQATGGTFGCHVSI
jgi:hypothetical protein